MNSINIYFILLYYYYFEWNELNCLHGKNEMSSSYSAFTPPFTVEITLKLVRREPFPTFQYPPESFFPLAKYPIMVELD